MFDPLSPLTTDDLGFWIAEICPTIPFRLPTSDPYFCVKSFESSAVAEANNGVIAGNDFYLEIDDKFFYAVARRTPNDISCDISAHYFCIAVFPRDEELHFKLREMSEHLSEGGPARELVGSIGIISATLVDPKKYKEGWANYKDSTPFCSLANKIIHSANCDSFLRVEYVQSHMKSVLPGDRSFISKNLGWRPRALKQLIDLAARNNYMICIPHHKVKLFNPDQTPTHLNSLVTDICAERGYMRLNAEKQTYFVKPGQVI